MKTGKKIIVLLFIFVAAVAVYFMWPVGHKDDSGVQVTYTAMEEAALPVVYPYMSGRQMGPLLGHREEKAVTAVRDSLLVLPEERNLEILVDEAGEVISLGYEIRSLEEDNLIERTELSEWSKEKNSISVQLPIQNLLEREKEYQLGIHVGLKDGSAAWYYARIIDTDNTYIEEMLTLAEEYSKKTFHYEEAQDLTVYMESSPTADNSSFGVVTLKNSFTQMTWGALGVERISEPRMVLKELAGSLVNVELKYEVSRQSEKGKEIYTVTENFTMKRASQRIYMMDYERSMNQLFTGGRELYSGKRILLGISDGKDLYVKKSANHRFTTFVHNRELWSYDSKEGISVRVFAFGGADEENLWDVRTNEDRHGVEILSVEENGDIDFLVYGYMNRGSHEGFTGVSYHRYFAESNTLEEQFFIPASESYETLKTGLEKLSHKGSNGILYLYMNQAVYGIDLTSHEYVVVASGLSSEHFAVSEDDSRLAWQEGSSLYDSRLLHIMDLDTGSKTQIGDETSDNVYRVLGFVGTDCVYGTGTYGDYIKSNGRIMGIYLHSLEIVDKNMDSAMHYEKDGYFIRDVKVEESRIHIERVREKSGGYFSPVSEDTLVCNVEALPGKMEGIGWYASDVKGRVYFVQLAQDIPSSQKIRTVSPKKMVSERQNEIQPGEAGHLEILQFYAYGRGRCLGVYANFADAVAKAYENMGIVCAGGNQPIWVRANKPAMHSIRDIQTAVMPMEKYQNQFTGESIKLEEHLLLDASGSTLNQVLYFVGQNIPVLIYTGEGQMQYLVGYDQSSVRLWNPRSGQTETAALEQAESWFEELGNDFICCISEK